MQMVDTRMPFRYGSAMLIRCPHLYMVATISDTQGRTARGIAADNLPPRWFDKDPTKSFTQEVADQLQVVKWASAAAQAEAPTTPFRLWLSIYQAVQQAAHTANLPPLLAGFGPSLVERAVNDAVGHLTELPFHSLLRHNILGVELNLIDPALSNITPQQVLPDQPLQAIAARHTVGLSDPIRTGDIALDDRLYDGLPQSLEEVIAFYGVRYFKIKIQNKLQEDIERLTAIATLLDSQLPATPYFCTLDGNEQYEALEQLLPVMEALTTHPVLKRLASSLLFIEQPLARSVALDPARCAGIERITQQFPVIIDESDDALDAYRRALEIGYSGTSHKNCKNAFKSVANLARSRRIQEQTGQPRLMSAEDLTNIGIVALQEDLTALSSLGITHAERNGHHYFRGLSHLSPEDQQRARRATPDLYSQGEDYVRLNITEGDISCHSLHQTVGLGVAAWPQLENFMAIEDFDIGQELQSPC
ncbi:MAG: hypothetical protein JO316_02060 [Abitibacteriaceae bacterium]|nr:hypothetical protein [Abditibacteriaceae bacterium]